LSNYVYVPGGAGGLFTITDEITGAVIKTFCLEINEYIGQDNLVKGISMEAVKGGRGGGSPDPISRATDWLYAQFIQNQAAYTPQALQIAFWLLEDEITLVEAAQWAVTYNWGGWLTTANGYVADANKYGIGSYGTQVLNLKSAINEDPRQSSLIKVPEPGILILLGIALSAVGLASRRYRL
jgi:hypothetical protein